jgi:hypothetical protein
MDGTSDNKSHHNTSTSSPLTDVFELRRDRSNGIPDSLVDSDSELSGEEDTRREGKQRKEWEDRQVEMYKKLQHQASSTDDSGDQSGRKKSDTPSEDERGKDICLLVPFGTILGQYSFYRAKVEEGFRCIWTNNPTRKR